MRFKLGELKGRGGKPTIKFGEWLQSLRQQGKAPNGVFPVVVIMLPSKYPSGAIIFETPDARVKKTVDGELLKQALKAFKFKRDMDKEGIRLNIVFDGKGEYYLETEDAPEDRIWKYEWRPSWGWRFIEVLGEQEEEEDIEF